MSVPRTATVGAAPAIVREQGPGGNGRGMWGEGPGRADSGRGRGLPRIRWRVIVGAALVTAAAGGVVIAHRAAQQPPSTRYVVVTSDVTAGTALSRDHLGTVAIDLPGAVDAVEEDDVDSLIGRVAARPLPAAALLRAGDVLEEGRFADPDEVEVTITLDSTRVPTGALHTGDVVAVLSTDPDGDGTRVLTDRARVAAIGDTEDPDGIGAGGGVRLRLAVVDGDTGAKLVDAAVNEELTLMLPAPGTSEAS